LAKSGEKSGEGLQAATKSHEVTSEVLAKNWRASQYSRVYSEQQQLYTFLLEHLVSKLEGREGQPGKDLEKDDEENIKGKDEEENIKGKDEEENIKGKDENRRKEQSLKQDKGKDENNRKAEKDLLLWLLEQNVPFVESQRIPLSERILSQVSISKDLEGMKSALKWLMAEDDTSEVESLLTNTLEKVVLTCAAEHYHKGDLHNSINSENAEGANGQELEDSEKLNLEPVVAEKGVLALTKTLVTGAVGTAVGFVKSISKPLRTEMRMYIVINHCIMSEIQILKFISDVTTDRL
jgi:hypothetical protein